MSEGRAETGKFEALGERSVAVARTSDTTEDGSWSIGTNGTLVGAGGNASERLLTTSLGSAVIGILEASEGRFVAVASTSETIEEGRSPTGIAVGSVPRLALTETWTSVGRAVIGMLEASIGRLVAVAKMEETKEDGSSVTGTIGTLAGGVLIKLDAREVGNTEMGSAVASLGRLVAVSRIEDTTDDGRTPVGTRVCDGNWLISDRALLNILQNLVSACPFGVILVHSPSGDS